LLYRVITYLVYMCAVKGMQASLKFEISLELFELIMYSAQTQYSAKI